MSKNLTKKIAIILTAIFASTVFSMFETAMANGSDTCTLKFDSTDNIKGNSESDLKEHSAKGLEDCQSKVTEALGKVAAEDTDKKAALQALQGDINSSLGAKQASAPIDDYLKNTLSITDISEGAYTDEENSQGNQCLSADDSLKVTTMIEEPLDIDIEDEDVMRNCTRNTLCIDRADRAGMECVSYINKEGFCSPQGLAHVKENPGKATLRCTPVQIFLSTSGTEMLFTYLGAIYKWAAGVTGIVAVLVIVVSGIQISAAAGDQQAVTNAKNRIVQSIGGLVLLFLSAIILNAINPSFFER